MSKIDLNTFDDIQGKILKEVRAIGALRHDDLSISFDTLNFIFENCSIFVSSNPDNDEILCSVINTNVENNEDFWTDISEIIGHVGEELGWVWVGKNSQGYKDMIAISFSGIEPNIIVTAMASRIVLYNVCRVNLSHFNI